MFDLRKKCKVSEEKREQRAIFVPVLPDCVGSMNSDRIVSKPGWRSSEESSTKNLFDPIGFDKTGEILEYILQIRSPISS